MNTLQVSAHSDLCNSPERGISQQLGNENRKRSTQYHHERRHSQIAQMPPVQWRLIVPNFIVENMSEHNKWVMTIIKDVPKINQFELHPLALLK